jgi:hypothetical protein
LIFTVGTGKSTSSTTAAANGEDTDPTASETNKDAGGTSSLPTTEPEDEANLPIEPSTADKPPTAPDSGDAAAADNSSAKDAGGFYVQYTGFLFLFLFLWLYCIGLDSVLPPPSVG